MTLGVAWLSMLAASAAGAVAVAGPERSARAPRRRPVSRFGSPTSPPPPASPSVTTAARPARSTCPRRWDRAAPSWMSMATAGRTSSSSSRWTGPAGRGRKRIRRSTGTTATGPSRTSRARRGWRSRCTGSASRPRTSTTTGTPTSTFRRSARAACSATTDAAASKTSRRRPASATPGSRRAPSGSTTTATAAWTCSWPATSSGRSRRTSSVR